jgi:hypothetical protein
MRQICKFLKTPSILCIKKVLRLTGKVLPPQSRLLDIALKIATSHEAKLFETDPKLVVDQTTLLKGCYF